MKMFPAITPLLWRVVAFLCLFVLISGAAGPRIIASDIFLRDGFGIYGSVGKAFIFGLIVFAVLVRRKPAVHIAPWHPKLLGWFAVSVVFFAVSWFAVSGLIDEQRSLMNVFAAHAGLLTSVIAALLGCLGVRNVRLLASVYRHELIIAGGIALAFIVFLHAVYALWQPLAAVVMYGVDALLQLSGLTTAVIPPNTIILDKFGITVAESCSGVESITLFTGLYLLIGVLDWQRLHRRRYFIVLPIALLLLMLFNIVRVYGLIVAGYFINPDIAFSLFHTYAGLIFFILYSALFWMVTYRHLVFTPTHKRKDPGDAKA